MWASLEHLDTVVSIAHRGGEMAKSLRGELRVDLKPDGSIVTNADKAVEAFSQERLLELTPEASIIGEEGGRTKNGADLIWSIDPIDGTSNYAFGLPIWGVSIGLLEAGVASLGVIYLPDLNRTYTAYRKGGAHLNGVRIETVKPGPIKPHELVANGDPRVDESVEEKLPGKSRAFGSFVFEASYCASGELRALTTTGPKIWDIAASLVICREVGLEARTFGDGELLKESEVARTVQCPAFGIAPKESNIPYKKFRP